MADVADPSQPQGPAAGPSPTAPPPGRLARSRGRVEAQVRAGKSTLDKARTTSRPVAFVFEAFALDGDSGGPVLAAALGFRAFLFQIPYFGFLLIVAGYVADLLDRPPKDLFHGKGIGGITAQALTNTSNLSGGARFTALLVATYALALGARSFLKVIRIVHVLVWKVPLAKMAKPTRATLAFIAIVTVNLVLSLAVTALKRWFLIGEIAGLVLYTLVPFFMWLLVSWWLPHRPCQIWALAPGAAFFAVGFQALHIVTVVWLPHQMQSKSETYGALGIALALLLWAYFLGRLMTLAAVLNFAFWDRRERDHPGSSLRALRVPLLDDHFGLILERLFPPRTVPPVADRGG